jgi:RNA polymerase sigma-70 factor, ECF subfamily
VSDADRHRLHELMDRYVDGDPVAFARLHARLGPRLRGLLFKLVRDGDTVDDLLQLTLLKAHLARERFAVPGGDPDGAVQAWYFAIARNVAMDHLRARSRAERRSARSEAASEDGIEAIADAAPHVEALHETIEREDEIVARIHDAIASLPEGQREVVELHKLRGMSMAQVAARLQLREGAVRVRAHRAYKALAQLMSRTPIEGLVAIVWTALHGTLD